VKIPEEVAEIQEIFDKEKKRKQTKEKERKHAPPEFLPFRSESEKKDAPGAQNFFIPALMGIWKERFPAYVEIIQNDFAALREISEIIAKQQGVQQDPITDPAAAEEIKTIWRAIVDFISKDKYFRNYNLRQVNKYIQSIIQSYHNANNPASTKGFSAIEANDLLNRFSD